LKDVDANPTVGCSDTLSNYTNSGSSSGD
jgi:hypothetical protein